MSDRDLLEQALDAGELSAAREILFRLSSEERELLRAEMGDYAFERCYRIARRLRRGPRKGRVIVLHGIMGGNLDVIERGDQDRVWRNYWRLLNGRFGDLELTPEGAPTRAGVKVVVTGQNKKYYLPMLLELHQSWHAKPFAYDWRGDIAESAHRLADLVKSFGQGEPVHLVAHSMGGLVSRCFIRMYPELWASMDDPRGHARGGRLIMLGTPNHGSYSIPLALSGVEKRVRQLALVDRKHNLKELLTILNTFAGSYQMLPSPRIDNGDDHGRLFDRKSWGSLPVHQPLLQRAARFHDSLARVVDGERFLYVAGYDRETPYRVRIESPGNFSYQHTRDGDGRVPHELGLLDGVTTLYVDETHGSLTIAEPVLDGIDELLERGTTRQLQTQAPRARAAETAEWTPAGSKESVSEELEVLLRAESSARSPSASRLTLEQQLRVESLLLADDDETEAADHAEAPPERVPPEIREIEVKVVWGDICKARGDVFAVGHYAGVLPQNAERALDIALSGTDKPDNQILRQHTIRGNLRGELGDIEFFPWNSAAGNRTVAVAGMGHPGSFGVDSLRLLTRKLVWSVANLPRVKTISTVLIGSGEGTLSVRESVHALVDGICEALARGGIESSVEVIEIVEIFHHRAVQIYDELQRAVRRDAVRELLEITLTRRTGRTATGWIAESEAVNILLEALAEAKGADAGSAARSAFALLEKMAADRQPGLRRQLTAALEYAMKRYEVEDQDVEGEDEDAEPEPPVRLSFSKTEGGVRVAAISNAATVSERVLRFDPRLIEDVVDEINETEEQDATRFSQFITRLVLPLKFREWLRGSGPFVFEVDRDMAQLHWEMLVHDLDVTDSREPLGVRCQVARQLRTTYSPPPSRAQPGRAMLRALVVGDPGDPSKGHSLPGARLEALAVARRLEAAGLDVDVLIGSAEQPRTGDLRDVEPATLIGVLDLLMRGGYDLLHYSGHGDFDPDDSDSAGWLFGKGRLLTSRELERVEAAPAIVVANACLSGRTAEVRESKLLPSLADEFFHRGVRNYIGTAWTVNDLGAVLFAETLYDNLLTRKTIGQAMLEARKDLHARSFLYSDLWAAYQHYGDPNSTLGK